MRIKKALIIAVVLIVGAIVWRKLSSNNTMSANTSTKANGGDAIKVEGIILKVQPIDNIINATGTVLPNEQVDLKSEINARIVKIGFSEGNHVSKGSLLVKLFDADLQAQKSKLELQKKLADEKEFREKNLLQKGAVSQEEYDNVLNQLNGLKADLDLIKSQIEKTEIRAPFDGVVGLRYASEGSYAMPTQKIASIVNDDKIKIDFSLPEKYATYVKKGSNIHFSVKNGLRSATAVVYATEPQIDAATRSLQVRAITNDKNFLPGTFVEVTIGIDKETKGIAVPTEAVVPELKGQKVYVYRAGKAVSQRISTGVRTDTQVEITEGLQIGDTVITKGVIKLRSNAPVKITLK